MVVEQGSVLDRIDFNVSDALASSKKANESLRRTLDAEINWRARGCIWFLVQMIVICVIILLLRFLY